MDRSLRNQGGRSKTAPYRTEQGPRKFLLHKECVLYDTTFLKTFPKRFSHHIGLENFGGFQAVRTLHFLLSHFKISASKINFGSFSKGICQLKCNPIIKYETIYMGEPIDNGMESHPKSSKLGIWHKACETHSVLCNGCILSHDPDHGGWTTVKSKSSDEHAALDDA